MSSLNKHVYELDELVIGNSLEAVSYSFLNQVPIIINDNSKIKFFDFFKPEDDLKKYKINQERYELHTNRGSLIVGSSKIEAWQKIVFSLSFLSSCSNDKDFFLTKENALISCGGKSRIIENENEEIINTEVKDLIDGIGKYVEFTVVETDKKGGKYRIINCYPSEEPQDSIIKTI